MYSNFTSLFHKKHNISTILPLFTCPNNYDDLFMRDGISSKNFKIYPIIESANSSSKVSFNINSDIYENNSTYKLPDLNKHVDSKYITKNNTLIDKNSITDTCSSNDTISNANNTHDINNTHDNDNMQLCCNIM